MNSTSANSSTTLSAQQNRRTLNEHIQVYARVRPLNSREYYNRSVEIIDVISPREIVIRHSVGSKHSKKFTFDRTFGPESHQVDVYTTVVAPLIEEVLAGYNCTVFAYGQTGTGKTHTMVGTESAELSSSWEDHSEIGIIPRALGHLFDELRLMEVEFSMRISYLELYNEELCDLLSGDDSIKIRIFDDNTKKGSVIIHGLEEIPVHSKDDVYKLLEKGKEKRKTATTLINANSSRSHTVFSIMVHIRENGIDGEEMLKIGKLNLVDLAGSENVSKAGNEKGVRVRETVNINQSLLTLGRVITALVERTPHIPYRESKLTRLLQESLGGRTKTSIIATISPSQKDIEETLSTLEYAHRAKNIQNKPEVNQKLTKKSVLKEYTEEIDKLKRDLQATREKNGIYLAVETYSEMTLKMDSQTKELNETVLLIKALKDELQNKERIFNEVSLNLIDKTEKLLDSQKILKRTEGVLRQTQKALIHKKQRHEEQNVLLNSHVKTEEELTIQAKQILEVAELASNDINSLHSTIERRKNVDSEIRSTCDRFAEHMRAKFTQMHENLNQFQKQHNSITQLLIEEFNNCSKNQISLTSLTNIEIEKLNEAFNKSVEGTYSITNKYITMLSDLSDEHRVVMENLLKDLKNEEIVHKSNIECSLSVLCNYSEMQTMKVNALREKMVNVYEVTMNSLKAFAANMRTNIAANEFISETNIVELEEIQTQIGNIYALADEKQKAMNAFIKQIKVIEAKEKDAMAAVSVSCDKVKSGEQHVVSGLKKSKECVECFSQQHCAENEEAQKRIDNGTTDILAIIAKSNTECSKLKEQSDSFCAMNTNGLDNLRDSASTYSSQVNQLFNENMKTIKEAGAQSVDMFSKACLEYKKNFNNSNQQQKSLFRISNEFCEGLEKHMCKYSEHYYEDMKECVHDVTKLTESDLQTYKSTGSTPSKRQFVYPRVFATTSPHSLIIKRIRQENNWPDLDTTHEENEEEESNGASGIIETEIVLNSTALESTGQKDTDLNKVLQCSSNSLKNCVSDDVNKEILMAPLDFTSISFKENQKI